MAYTGRQAWVGFGQESAWNTPVSRTQFFELVSETMSATQGWTPRGVLYEGASGVARTGAKFNSGSTFAGTVVFQGRYEGMGLPLRHAMWSNSTTGPSGGLYTHTFVLGTAPPTGGLTMEIQRGDGTFEVWSGGRVNKFSMTVNTAGIATVTLDLIFGGRDSRAILGGTSPSFTTNRDAVLKHNQVSTLAWNSTTAYLRMLKVDIDNKLTPRPLLGSLITADPGVMSGVRSVSISTDTEWSADEYDIGHQDGTESDAVVSFTGPSSNTLTVTLHDAFISSNSAPVSNFGIISESSTFMGQDDGTHHGLAIVVVNTQSSATAA
jgi:hypothetical protein